MSSLALSQVELQRQLASLESAGNALRESRSSHAEPRMCMVSFQVIIYVSTL